MYRNKGKTFCASSSLNGNSLGCCYLLKFFKPGSESFVAKSLWLICRRTFSYITV